MRRREAQSERPERRPTRPPPAALAALGALWALAAGLAALATPPAGSVPTGGRLRALARAEQAIPYTTGTWDPETLGNHRVVVRVGASADAVRVRIPWRRRDPDPEAKDLWIVGAASTARILNVVRVSVTREAGDLVFEPAEGRGDYHVYYLPNSGAGRSNYPKVVYPAPRRTADEDWLRRNGLDVEPIPTARLASLPEAAVVEFQAVDDFNRFDPMEVIATAAETAALLAAHPSADVLLFPEDRRYPIRMTGDLPQRWIEAGANGPFRGEAARGETYAFQVGVFAARRGFDDLAVTFSGLSTADRRHAIPASAFHCLNTGGSNWDGRPLVKSVPVARGTVQALWMTVEIPDAAAPGSYAGSVTVTPKGLAPIGVPITIAVGADAIVARGDDEPWRHSRLRWLDSRLGLDDETVPPYTPVTVAGETIGVLGRSLTIDELGFPRAIGSRFTPDLLQAAGPARDLLAGPIALMVESADPAVTPWVAGGAPARVARIGPGAAGWEARAAAGPLALRTRGRMEFDGCVDYQVSIRADRQTVVSDIRLEIPIARDVARYMMGFGFKGGRRPARYDWTWAVERNHDAVWIGDVNAGLQVSLRDDRYERPLNTNFYLSKPLVMPASWDNGGKGGCRLREEGETVRLSCYSGPRVIARGAVLRYDFRLLLTPFKPIDPPAHFRDRYFHQYRPIDEVVANGGNTINIHHANAINPWINYPFLTPRELKAYIDEAHAKGLKVKIYNTVREISNRAPELFALRSLGTEILSPGPGGGFSWLQEHLGGNYIAAWFVPPLKDAAVINSGVSRWHNYYVEGIDWLARNLGIDGLYIDDVAFDRTTMKRVRKVLARRRPDPRIDLHSANQFNVRDGWVNSANLYLEHFPYVDRLWFGEYFDYDSSPDFWLVELSGIPFGVMGEMLQEPMNPWRGMVYGMTGRAPRADNRPLWRTWDAFGLADSRMVGYWVPGAPVTTGRTDVLATTYIRPERSMVALASWAPAAERVRLRIDWVAIGLDPSRARITAPAIDRFQPAASFSPDEPIPIEPGRGWLVLIEPRTDPSPDQEAPSRRAGRRDPAAER